MITFPEAEEGFQALAGDLAFVGHTHQPLALAKEARGEVQVISPEEVILKEGIRYIINVGSVGQPRDSNPQAAYGLYDDVAKKIYSKTRDLRYSSCPEKDHQGRPSLLPGPTSLEGKLISSNSHSRTGTYLQKSVLDHFVPFGLTWVVARGPGKA